LATLPIYDNFAILGQHATAEGTGKRSEIMRWSKPKIVEIAVGTEINSYACAAIA
jgi:coenzyme PQQ precursor peptide PqqA